VNHDIDGNMFFLKPSLPPLRLVRPTCGCKIRLTMHTPSEAQLQETLNPYGLSLRGAFVPEAADKVPDLPDGKPADIVWLVGVVGSNFWSHFKTSTFFSDGLSDPLDRWSCAVAEELAARFGGVALYPFDGPPYHPFQRWADRAEATQPSRMLVRIHPVYGLWHAYRFALALAATPGEDLAATAHASKALNAADLCVNCHDQPCLNVCPVQAYTGTAFLVNACAQHLHSGTATDCMQNGCLARRACPVGADFRYGPEHAAFHMQAFAKNHPGK
jgi:cytochrome c553